MAGGEGAEEGDEACFALGGGLAGEEEVVAAESDGVDGRAEGVAPYEAVEAAEAGGDGD